MEKEEEEEGEDDEDWVFSFGNEEERQKFFSTVKNRRRSSAPGSLFILPKFLFPSPRRQFEKHAHECIREAIWDANTTGNAVALRGEGEPEDFRGDLLNCAMAIVSRGTIEAFRIVAREMFLSKNKTIPYPPRS